MFLIVFIYFWLSWVFTAAWAFPQLWRVAVVVHELLIAVVFLVGERRLWGCRPQELWPTGLVALWHMGASQTRDGSHDLCTGRLIRMQYVTRESRGILSNAIICCLVSG